MSLILVEIHTFLKGNKQATLSKQVFNRNAQTKEKGYIIAN